MEHLDGVDVESHRCDRNLDQPGVLGGQGV